MKFVLDSNVLIDSNRWDFPLDKKTSQPFWEHLIKLGESGVIFIPEYVCDEILKGSDLLKDFVKGNKGKFCLPTTQAAHQLPQVLLSYGDGRPLGEKQVEKLRADPYVIAHAIEAKATVVTGESRGNFKEPERKRIPNICDNMKIPVIRLPKLVWEFYNNPALTKFLK